MERQNKIIITYASPSSSDSFVLLFFALAAP